MCEDMDMIQERYELAYARIREIPGESLVCEPFCDFFEKVADFILLVLDSAEGEAGDKNEKLYHDILPAQYAESYGNPQYAAKVLGDEYGRLLSFLYTEVRGMIPFCFEKRTWDITIVMELFLEVYHMFGEAQPPEISAVKECLYWYCSDYCDEIMEYRVREMLDYKLDFAYQIIMNSDLSNLDYLYGFGEYITENERKTAGFLNSLSQEEIDQMAKTYTEGYRIGFINAGIDLSKKQVVNIRYCLGFERMIRAAILQFEQMGLKPTIYRSASHSVNKRQNLKIGYYGAVANKQYEYDHRQDCAIYLDEDFVQRKLRSTQVAYEKYKDLAAVHGGPAVVEIFGEHPFTPMNIKEACQLSEVQQKLQVSLDNQSSQITNRYIKGDERSFTIIAFPVPEIGTDFNEIFKEVVKINTLDYEKYAKIQQYMIDALDCGDRVHIKGKDKNRTDLIVNLCTLNNPDKETIFENCVADVNIPVGEVFTSPVLKGTSGTLHVSQVYLNELNYKDLELHFTDGQVDDYHCSNFEKEQDNKRYVEDNVLFHHGTLPMGEFAIGTNTTAYVMARKYQIEEKLPILIAEKMGPHFAVGDTCYSWAEDNPVYNRDGKEIVARDNEISILRKTDLNKAYFGCHTDITIPYEELDYIRIQNKDGSETSIIEGGRFVLPGTLELNQPLEEAGL